jgi:RimJ/RimL family protein N-acetyltransferase
MFVAFDEAFYNGKSLNDYKFVVGGQVCVDSNYRGNGLLSRLYHATKDHLLDDYELCVTEVSSRNHNSLKVHQKMGFDHVHTYDYGVEVWNVIVWDMRE